MAEGQERLDLDAFIHRHLACTKHVNEKNTAYAVEELVQLCRMSIEVLKKEPTLAEINPPVIVVGDIHGQFYDLLRLFSSFSTQKGSGIKIHKYLFLGDYVDRGRCSLECICFVLALKIRYPKKYQLLRGNHETKLVNMVYGFYDELADRYQKEAMMLWELFNEVFNYLPLAGCVGKVMLCMHGGISPHLNSLDDIRNIQRPLEETIKVPLAVDLLWSDPADNITGYEENKVRGVSVCFGEDAVHECCAKLNIKVIVRAHQVMMSGYGFFANRRLITIFTAPRYQTESTTQKNFGAVLVVNRNGKIGFKILRPSATESLAEEKFTDGPSVASKSNGKSVGRTQSISSSSSSSAAASLVTKMPVGTIQRAKLRRQKSASFMNTVSAFKQDPQKDVPREIDVGMDGTGKSAGRKKSEEQLEDE